MKKLLCLSFLLCFLSPAIFAQSNEEIKEEIKIEMKNLQIEMDNLQEELKDALSNLDFDFDFDFDNFEIDLSGLDALDDIDWEEHIEDEKDRAYFESGKFQEEMEEVRKEVREAMKEVNEEIQNINMDEINKAVEDAMKEVKEELKKIDKDN